MWSSGAEDEIRTFLGISSIAYIIDSYGDCNSAATHILNCFEFLQCLTNCIEICNFLLCLTTKHIFVENWFNATLKCLTKIEMYDRLSL